MVVNKAGCFNENKLSKAISGCVFINLSLGIMPTKLQVEKVALLIVVKSKLCKVINLDYHNRRKHNEPTRTRRKYRKILNKSSRLIFDQIILVGGGGGGALIFGERLLLSGEFGV